MVPTHAAPTSILIYSQTNSPSLFTTAKQRAASQLAAHGPKD